MSYREPLKSAHVRAETEGAAVIIAGLLAWFLLMVVSHL